MNIIKEYCPYCGSTFVAEGYAIRKLEYKWICLLREVSVNYCICCGAEIPNPIRDRMVAEEMQRDIEKKYIEQNYTREEIWKRSAKRIMPKVVPQSEDSEEVKVS